MHVPRLLNPNDYRASDFLGDSIEERIAGRDEVVEEWNDQIRAAAGRLDSLGVDWYQLAESPMYVVADDHRPRPVEQILIDYPEATHA